MKHQHGSSSLRRRRVSSVHSFLLAVASFTGVGLLFLTLRSVDDSPVNDAVFPSKLQVAEAPHSSPNRDAVGSGMIRGAKSCATVEEMGEEFKGEAWMTESLRVRTLIRNHFALNGASNVRDLPPEQFCTHGFVLGKASEAGFGNEMYKILNVAALSIILNRSLIIGQTRHIGESIRLGITFLIPINLSRCKKSSIFGGKMVV